MYNRKSPLVDGLFYLQDFVFSFYEKSNFCHFPVDLHFEATFLAGQYVCLFDQAI